MQLNKTEYFLYFLLKVLKIGEDYTPGVSGHVTARILDVDSTKKSYKLKLISKLKIKKKKKNWIHIIIFILSLLFGNNEVDCIL